MEVDLGDEGQRSDRLLCPEIHFDSVNGSMRECESRACLKSCWMREEARHPNYLGTERKRHREDFQRATVSGGFQLSAAYMPAGRDQCTLRCGSVEEFCYRRPQTSCSLKMNREQSVAVWSNRVSLPREHPVEVLGFLKKDGFANRPGARGCNTRSMLMFSGNSLEVIRLQPLPASGHSANPSFAQLLPSN